MKRRALCALFLTALFLISVPGASAKTCTASLSGGWATAATWSCSPAPNTAPGAADAVVIPAGKTVTVPDDVTAAQVTLLGGTLSLGTGTLLATTALTVSGGGTIGGAQDAAVTVTLAGGAQAAIDGGGLTVAGPFLAVTGAGTFAIAGPLVIDNGGAVESDVATSWTGTAPWRIGGSDGAPATAVFEMSGAPLTMSGATSAQSPGNDGQIRLDGAATLTKLDATTSTLALDVSLDTPSAVDVEAGELIGSFEGSGALSVAAGATLGLSGTALQLAPPTIDLAGGTLEIEPQADIALVLPGEPRLLGLALATGASLEVSVDDHGGGSDPAPDVLAQDIAIADGGTLGLDGGTGSLELTDHQVLSGSGSLDSSLANSAGTVSPSGDLHVTGDYAQGAGGTLALDLRRPADGDSLRVDGAVTLSGTLRVATRYAPAATANPLVLGASLKPAGAFDTITAPLASGRNWKPGYGEAGVTLIVAGQRALHALALPALRPALPVVGGRTSCVPGTPGGAHAFSYRWLRDGKPIAEARSSRYRVRGKDRGHRLACRVLATTDSGARAAMTSTSARVRLGLGIGRPLVGVGGGISVALHCARGERRCHGSLRVLVAGRVVAAGHFALAAPGGTVRLTRLSTGLLARDEHAVVSTSYRNGAGQGRTLLSPLQLAG